MTLYQKFKKLDINHAAIELMAPKDYPAYFCTPKGARVIGSAGVDGIHYCFVRGLGETVFAVSPMNEPGRNVFPLARNFEDLLRLLLAAGSMAALEQAHQWDEEQFEEFVAENPPAPEAVAAFDVIEDKLGIVPMENPFDYLRGLQDSYDYGQLRFSNAYYEAFDAASEEEPAPWRVTLDGGFRPERGKAGKEISINKQFAWGGEVWHVPAVYLFSGGLVADFCVAVDLERIKAYFQKAKAMEEQGYRPSYEERLLLRREDPVNINFYVKLALNGEEIRNARGSGQTYLSAAITGDDSWEDREGKQVLEHYGLDLNRAWVIRRCTFPWEGRRKDVEIKSLRLYLERGKTDLPGIRFTTPGIGESASFTHPLTGVEHTLTVREVKAQELDKERFQDKEFDFPNHFTAMTYTIHPDLPNDAFMLKDCDNGDSPRRKQSDPHGRFAMSVGAIAMIRSKDGPAEVFYVGDDPLKPHVICSSLHFDPASGPVEWQLVFREKLMEDVNVDLIPERSE